MNLEKFSESAGLPALFAKGINLVEKEMLELPQVPCPVVHSFGPGLYMREVHLPAGAIAIGHHQNFEHQNIFLKGRVTILNEDGTTTEMKAPMRFVGKPGRKIGFVHEDVVWINIYATSETDVEKLELMFLTKSDGWKENAALLSGIKKLQRESDQKDFDLFLSEMGLSAVGVRAQSEDTSDMTELPFGGYKIKVADSYIEGRGLFTTADIEVGELIAPARVSGKRTIAGRFTNHSVTPNAKMVRGPGDDIHLVAMRGICGCRGGQDGEEVTINYRSALKLNKEIAQEVRRCLE